MTTDSVHAHLEFSFQGESHVLDARISLEEYRQEEAPSFHLHLARTAGIDPYSYLYEVLETEDIEFSQATGRAAACLRDGRFDWECYVGRRRDAEDLDVVADIARRLLGVADLAAREDLRAALLAAFRAGKARGS